MIGTIVDPGRQVHLDHVARAERLQDRPAAVDVGLDRLELIHRRTPHPGAGPQGPTLTLEWCPLGAALEGAPALIARAAAAVGRTVAARPGTAERRTIPIGIWGAIPSGPRAAEGRAVAGRTIAAKGRPLPIAPAAVEGGPISLRPAIPRFTLSLELPPTFRTRTAKRGPITPWALAVGAALAILEGRPAVPVPERRPIPALERGPFALLAKGTALPAFERRPFGTPALLAARLERRPFRPSTLGAVILERGPFAAPPAFILLTAIVAAREGPVIPRLARVKAAPRGSRRLEWPPALLAALLPTMARSTAAGTLIITAEPSATPAWPTTTGPFVIAVETAPSAAAAGKTAA
ncbi:MAG TPA: hypothetical protein VNL35_18985 [Chloroflexota bacterium]|nr:hypothetical protein [Chloroflexota bacterium]